MAGSTKTGARVKPAPIPNVMRVYIDEGAREIAVLMYVNGNPFVRYFTNSMNRSHSKGVNVEEGLAKQGFVLVDEIPNDSRLIPAVFRERQQ